MEIGEELGRKNKESTRFWGVTNCRGVLPPLGWAPPPPRLRRKNQAGGGVKSTENIEKRYDFPSPSSLSHTHPYFPLLVDGWWLLASVWLLLKTLVLLSCQGICLDSGIIMATAD